MDKQIQTGLKLVEGYSFETLTQRLKKASIDFQVGSEPHPKNTYFRASSIGIKRKSSDATLKVLGEPPRNLDSEPVYYAQIYYGKYEIGKDFDWTQLDGNPRFKQGKLVEEICIDFL